MIGLEIDIYFSGDNDCRHLICIFKSIDDWFSKIENYCLNNKKDSCSFYFSTQPLPPWCTLFEGSLCIPHYSKSDKKHNFTDDQIHLWNESKILPTIQCLEIAPNLLSYWYFLQNEKVSDKFHCIVCNDREISSLASFMCFNDNDQLNNENILTKILTFLKKKITWLH